MDLLNNIVSNFIQSQKLKKNNDKYKKLFLAEDISTLRTQSWMLLDQTKRYEHKLVLIGICLACNSFIIFLIFMMLLRGR